MSWLESGAKLLAEPDPGPTPFLVERLVVADSILAIVGPHKVGKTWLILELATSIVSGRPAFGTLTVKQGPVILVLEESGRAAFHRRLSAHVRGRGIAADELADLHFATNRGIRLSVEAGAMDSWRDRIRTAAKQIKPAAVIFDPLSRVKGSVDENAQTEMAEVLDYFRDLREEVQTTVGFAHHTGHAAPGRMRGTSDLEAYWESKLTIQRSGHRSTLTAEHREAEAMEPIDYRITFGERTVRLELDLKDGSLALRRQIVNFLAEHPDSTFGEIRAGVGKNKAACRSSLSDLDRLGMVASRRTTRPDRNGVERPVDVYFLSSDAGSTPVQDSRNGSDPHPAEPMRVRVRPPIRGGTGTATAGVER